MPYPERLEGRAAVLERWDVERHTEPFVELCADPEVMAFLGGPASRAVAEEASTRIDDHWRTFGFGLWAAIEPESGRTAGFVGACRAAWLAGYEHEVELGWRLARWAWGRGLATAGGRAAIAALAAGPAPDRVIAVVDPENERSLAVADRLGLAHHGETAINTRLGKRVLILV